MLAYGGGDAGAFETLYARHRGGLFRFILRAVKDRGSAEELFQEAWVRVIESRSRYAPKARFTTWLYTIAHNRLVDHWRHKELALVPARDDEEAPEADGAASTLGDPARQLEGREALARFARALEDLPRAQREAFLLHEEAGMTAMEIAAVTGSEEEFAGRVAPGLDEVAAV